jgi:Tol biopolymer transport system component
LPHRPFDDFAAHPGFSDLALHPDGGRIAYVSDASGAPNVWWQGVDPGADGSLPQARRLTHFVDGAVHRVVWSPDGSRLLLTADRDGNESFELHEIEMRSGEVRALTSRGQARCEIGDDPFDPSGRRIAYACNDLDPADFDILVRDLARWTRSGSSQTGPGTRARRGHSMGVIWWWCAST